MRVRFRVRFHQRMTYVIWMSSAHRPDTCLSCPISCSTTPGVICMLSAHHLQTHMSSTCCPHIVCMLSAHTCHLHAIHISATHFPELPNFMQYYTWCHLHIICRHTCHPHVIHRCVHHPHIVCRHICHPYVICRTPHGQRGPELSFYCDRNWLLNGICRKNVELFHFRIM